MEAAVNNGMCRCCASEGTFKDMKTTYHWMGDEEIYSDMLQECFDITLTMSQDGANGGICEVCITQLRNAANFKKQVQHTEEQFISQLEGKVFKGNVVKIEPSRDDDDELEADGGNTSDFSDPEYELPIKKEEVEEPKPKKRAAATRASTARAKKAKAEEGEPSTKRDQQKGPMSNKPIDTVQLYIDSVKLRIQKFKSNMNAAETGTKMKNDEVAINTLKSVDVKKKTKKSDSTTKKRKRLKRVNDKKRTKTNDNEMTVDQLISEDEKNQSSNSSELKDRIAAVKQYCKTIVKVKKNPNRKIDKENLAKFRNNITTVLQFSNATPIRSHEDSGYACCYCKDEYQKPADLKKHTIDTHNKIDLWKPIDMNIPIKMDITSLRCEICFDGIDGFYKLLDHLQEGHQKIIYREIDLIIPFKFDTENLQCCLCPMSFDRYKILREHMSVHYRHYICDQCGAGFVTTKTLKSHVRRIHLNRGIFKCNICDKVFNTNEKMRSHHSVVHTRAQFVHKCGICKEQFKCFSKKQHHLSKVHGLSDVEYKCKVCDETFSNYRNLWGHTSTSHLSVFKKNGRTVD